MVLTPCKTTTVNEVIEHLKDFGPIIVGCLALVLSYFQNSRTVRSSNAQNLRTIEASNAQNLRTLNAKNLEEKRAEIQKKLNDFYGPIIQLRKKSDLLYHKFSERLRLQDPNFATLPFLLDNGQLEHNEDILLQEIIKIGKITEDLISEKAGLIDVPELRLRIIPRASTHFLIMRLAYDKILIGDGDKYTDLTFPRDLDTQLEARKLELEQELQKLTTNT